MPKTQATNLQDHNKRSHALLAASSAGRWLNCTPSARLEEQYGEKETTPYAQEGTLAHEIAELYLRHDGLNAVSDEDFDNRIEELMSSELFNDEMLDVIPIYTDYCLAQFTEAKALNAGAEMVIEAKIDLTAYIPEGFGTADCCIINDNILEVIDLKYGKGVPVHADWNKQLMTYGLGALYWFDSMYDITEVRLTIVQPRLNNISSFMISADELRNWGENELKPGANKAFVGEGDLSAGEWCRFCAVKNQCRALYKQQVEIAKHEFKEPYLLSDDEIADIIRKTPALVEWANSITAYANKRAIEEGKIWPGFKLVEGISRRKWIDEDKAAEAILIKLPELSDDEIYNMKLKSITDIEKLVGKRNLPKYLTML